MSNRKPSLPSKLALVMMSLNMCYGQYNEDTLPADTVSKMACLAYEDYNYFDLRPLRNFPMQFTIDGDDYLYNPCQFINL